MVRLTVLASYVIFILGTGPLAGWLYGGCWPACSQPMKHEATVDQGSCTDPGDSCCSETTRLAPLPAKPSPGHPAFHADFTHKTDLDRSPDGHHVSDAFLAAYGLDIWRPPSHLIPLRI